MCIKYECHGCKVPNTIYCRQADWNEFNPNCQQPIASSKARTSSKKCPTCKLVEGVIYTLRQMIFQQPWLETEIVGGIENRPSWELESTTSKDESHIDWGLPYSMELIDRLKDMGLDKLDGKEELNDGHGVASCFFSGDDEASTSTHEDDSNRRTGQNSFSSSDKDSMRSEAAKEDANRGQTELDDKTAN